MHTLRHALAFACATIALASCATPRVGHMAPAVTGARYVAMGSSYAAGPGVTTSADEPRNRCARSADNYAHLLARTLHLQLVDVSCSGATTAHVLGTWKELQPQIDALTNDTRLVTVTIGGNDVGYFGMLWSASCGRLEPALGALPMKCPVAPASADAWDKLDAGMRSIAAEVRRRSPSAQLVFVDYLSVLPNQGTCDAAPMTEDQARAIRATARKLVSLTARIVAEAGGEVLKASEISKDHDACSREPWITGFSSSPTAGFVPYHPNASGMAAIANALARRLGSR